MEYKQNKDEESYEEYDDIEDEEYAEDDTLPTLTVSSLKNNVNLASPKMNTGISAINISDTENMNKISSFRLK